MSLSSLKNLKDLAIETNKLSTQHLKQATRIKRINSIPAQAVYKDLLLREGHCNAVVGGGAGSGFGLGHMATTLTSFNVSAIANAGNCESADEMNMYGNDINAQEKQEIYQ